MFKVNNRNTRKRCEICSKLIIKTPEGIFIVNFGRVSHLFLVLLFLTLNKQALARGLYPISRRVSVKNSSCKKIPYSAQAKKKEKIKLEKLRL